MPFSTAYDETVMNHVFGAAAYTPPANIYFGLSTTAPAKDGTGITEVSGNGYTRATMANNATNFPNATASAGVTTKANGAAIAFPQATGSWGTPGYWLAYDASTAGTLIAYGTITTPKAIGSGDTPSLAAGSWDLTIQ